MFIKALQQRIYTGNDFVTLSAAIVYLTSRLAGYPRLLPEIISAIQYSHLTSSDISRVQNELINCFNIKLTRIRPISLLYRLATRPLQLSVKMQECVRQACEKIDQSMLLEDSLPQLVLAVAVLVTYRSIVSNANITTSASSSLTENTATVTAAINTKTTNNNTTVKKNLKKRKNDDDDDDANNDNNNNNNNDELTILSTQQRLCQQQLQQVRLDQFIFTLPPPSSSESYSATCNNYDTNNSKYQQLRENMTATALASIMYTSVIAIQRAINIITPYIKSHIIPVPYGVPTTTINTTITSSNVIINVIKNSSSSYVSAHGCQKRHKSINTSNHNTNHLSTRNVISHSSSSSSSSSQQQQQQQPQSQHQSQQTSQQSASITVAASDTPASATTDTDQSIDNDDGDDGNNNCRYDKKYSKQSKINNNNSNNNDYMCDYDNNASHEDRKCSTRYQLFQENNNSKPVSLPTHSTVVNSNNNRSCISIFLNYNNRYNNSSLSNTYKYRKSHIVSTNNKNSAGRDIIANVTSEYQQQQQKRNRP